MANPKFRRLEYPLYSALMKAKLPGSAYQVLLVVINYTIGYRRQTAPISLTRFQDLTGLSRQGVIKGVKYLEKWHILTVCRQGTNAREATIYVVNDEAAWITGKRQLPTPLVNASSLG